MTTAKIADLKNNLSRYLKRVQAGETIRVLDRDLPVAEIIPYHRSEGDFPHHLAELEKAGLVRRGPLFGKPFPKSWLREPRPGKGAGVLDALLEDRAKDR